MNEQRDDEEWEILYSAICDVCAKHGKENPFGDADYWVVDDNWGSSTQKVVVSSSKFLTPRLAEEILQCIGKTGVHGAKIFVSLEFEVDGKKVPPVGLMISSSGVREEWDLELLRDLIGEDFYTDR